MSRRMLVSMNRNDSLEEIMTYIEELAQPGMKVVFLVQWNRDGFGQLKDVQTGMKPGNETASAGVGTTEAIDLQQQRLLEEKVFSTSRALRQTGVEIGVDLYTGSWGELMERYKADGEGYILIL